MMLIFFLPAVNICRTLKVEFISESQWLNGNNWWGATSRIEWTGPDALISPLSITPGSGFIGQSTLDGNKEINIDIYFSTHTDSQSVAPVYSVEPDTGVFLGMGTFPGTVWDISDPTLPRRINICFFEKSGGDLIWNPKHVAHGYYEYLIIMLSDYDEGVMYEGKEAYNLDVQYFCWLKKMVQETWFGTLPAVLQFRNFWDISLSAIPSGSQVTLNWEHEDPTSEIQEILKYELFRGFDENLDTLISEFEVGINSFTDKNLVNYTPYYYQILGYDSKGDTLVASKVITATPFITQYHTKFISNWGNTDDNPYPANWGVSNYNDIWGYTDEMGTEYALIGAWKGTYIIDISSNSSVPQEVAFVPGSFSTHRDIKTFGDHMYIGTEANRPDPDSLINYNVQHIIPQGIQVVDLADPHNPILVNEWDLIYQSHNIMEYNGYLYIIGSKSDVNEDGNTSDIIVLDLVSNPSMLTYVGEWSGHYIHDVCFKDNILYGCGIQTKYGGGLDDKMFALDITKPDSIFEIHQWEGVFAAHSCGVSEDGNTLYTGQETTNGHIKSWDVTDLANGNVNLIGEWVPQGGENWSAHNLFVKGNYLYISYYVYGLQILDISDPTNIVHIGHYDTFVESFSSGIYEGAWGVYPYFDSNTIIISDRNSGLYVVDFDPVNLSLNSEPILIPDQISIQNIYPNPFNPFTHINYSLPYVSNIKLTIYDLLGRQVEILHNGVQHPNNYTITWDASKYSSGVYLVQMTIQDTQNNDKPNFIQIQQVVLLK